MDSAQHCLDQSADCRRLMKLAQTKIEAEALRNLSSSWSRLAESWSRLSEQNLRLDKWSICQG